MLQPEKNHGHQLGLLGWLAFSYLVNYTAIKAEPSGSSVEEVAGKEQLWLGQCHQQHLRAGWTRCHQRKLFGSTTWMWLTYHGWPAFALVVYPLACVPMQVLQSLLKDHLFWRMRLFGHRVHSSSNYSCEPTSLAEVKQQSCHLLVLLLHVGLDCAQVHKNSFKN